MAAIDENVQTLLSVLDDTPAGVLADAVRERIRAIDEPAEAKTIYPRERARNQIKMANEIVTGFIERELNMTKRLKAIAAELKIKAVPVVTGEGTPTDDLIDGQRRQTLVTFQDAWGALVRNILDGMAGRDGFQG